MMHADLLFPSKYLKAVELRDQDVTMTIYKLQAKEKLVMVGGKTDIKPLLFFEEARTSAAKKGEEEKRMVLNPTNKNTICKLYGTETDDWIGKRITLFPEPCAQSPSGFAIRIRPVVPPAKGGNKPETKSDSDTRKTHDSTDSIGNGAEPDTGSETVPEREKYNLKAECQTCGGKYPKCPVNVRTGCCDGCETGEPTANEQAMGAIGLGDADIERGNQ